MVRHRPVVAALSAALCAAALSACGAEQPARADRDERARPDRQGPAAGREVRVPLEVVEARNGATLALVPVYVNGEGPLPFAVDTGASQSVIDREVAARVGLRVKRRAVAHGVGGRAQGVEVAVRDWRAGESRLPVQQIVSLDLAEDRRGDGLEGLLGSDVLNLFDAVTVDYRRETLILRPREG